MKNIIVGLLFSLILISGCFESNQNKKIEDHLKQDIKSSAEIVRTSSEEIDKASKTIDENVIGIKLDTNNISAIKKSANNISVESQKLKGTSKNLSETAMKLEITERTLNDYTKQTNETEKENAKLIEENAKLNESIKTGLNKMLKWIVGGCLIGAGLCAATALFFGNIKGGLFGSVTCITIMVLAIAVGQYMAYIAIAGIFAIIMTLAILGYQLFIQRRAISDNVWTQEVAKRLMPIDIKEKIYGSKNETGKAGFIQSTTTKKIIKQIKNKLPAGWKVMKEDNII